MILRLLLLLNVGLIVGNVVLNLFVNLAKVQTINHGDTLDLNYGTVSRTQLNPRQIIKLSKMHSKSGGHHTYVNLFYFFPFFYLMHSFY